MPKTISPRKAGISPGFIEIGNKKIALRKLPANRVIDDSQFIPVIDGRTRSLPVQGVRLEDVAHPFIPAAGDEPAFGLINAHSIDNYGPLYGAYSSPRRFQFRKSTIPYTDVSGWYFNRSPFDASVDHMLEFVVRTFDLTVVLLKFQTYQATYAPVIMTVNIDGRKFNLDVGAQNRLKLFHVYFLPNPEQKWMTASFDIRNQFNAVRHELCVTAIQLFESILLPPPDLPTGQG